MAALGGVRKTVCRQGIQIVGKILIARHGITRHFLKHLDDGERHICPVVGNFLFYFFVYAVVVGDDPVRVYHSFVGRFRRKADGARRIFDGIARLHQFRFNSVSAILHHAD